MEGPKIQKEFKIDASFGSGAHPYQNPLYEQKVGPHIHADKMMLHAVGLRGNATQASGVGQIRAGK